MNINLQEVANIKQDQRYLYHATYRQLILSIQKYGFGGNKNKSSLWSLSKTNVTYWASSALGAALYTKLALRRNKQYSAKDIVVFRCPIEKFDRSKLENDRNYPDDRSGAYEYSGIIDFNDVEEVENYFTESHETVNNTEDDDKKSYCKYQNDIDYVLEQYRKIFNFDLSYMKFKVSSQPVYINGEPCHEYDQDECAGDWTELGFIRLNPDMKSVMDRYGVEWHNATDIDIFTKKIIAHELAHEMWNKVASDEFKRMIYKTAVDTGFTTAYLKTVRPSKIEEETFCEAMADIVVSSDILEFKSISERLMPEMIQDFFIRTNNQRYDSKQFEEYLSGEKYSNGKTLWYGCFEDGECMSLAVLKKYKNDGIILLAAFQSIIKGYGKPLLENILSRSKNIWWCAEPEDGESLADYYRQFDVKEHLIKMSKWTDSPEYVFYKADEKHEPLILDMLNKADKTHPDFDPNTL